MPLPGLRRALVVGLGAAGAGRRAGVDARDRVGAGAAVRHDHDAAAARLEHDRLAGPRHERRRTLRRHPGAELHRRLGRGRAALPVGLAGESGAAGAALDPRGPGAGPAHRGRVGRRVDAPGGRGRRAAPAARGKQPGHLGRTRRDADRGGARLAGRRGRGGVALERGHPRERALPPRRAALGQHAAHAEPRRRLWVQLSEDASWWQSGTAGTEFVFEESVHPETEAAIRAEVARVLAFFYESYGMEPVELSVMVDPSRIGPGLVGAAHALARGDHLGRSYTTIPERFFLLPHEYFHVIQWQFTGRGSPDAVQTPNWLIEGTATCTSKACTSGNGWARRGVRFARIGGADDRVGHPPFGPTFDHGGRLGPGWLLRGTVGALATDWLVRRAAALSTGERFAPLEPPELVARPDHDAHLEFFRLLPTSASWEEAFEAAFGIAVDDFYEAFAEYWIALGAVVPAALGRRPRRAAAGFPGRDSIGHPDPPPRAVRARPRNSSASGSERAGGLHGVRGGQRPVGQGQVRGCLQRVRWLAPLGGCVTPRPVWPCF